jgi:hypothetical protein
MTSRVCLADFVLENERFTLRVQIYEGTCRARASVPATRRLTHGHEAVQQSKIEKSQAEDGQANAQAYTVEALNSQTKDNHLQKAQHAAHELCLGHTRCNASRAGCLFVHRRWNEDVERWTKTEFNLPGIPQERCRQA